jgi:hypothetical protein
MNKYINRKFYKNRKKNICYCIDIIELKNAFMKNLIN